MFALLSAVIVAGAAWWAATLVQRELKAAREEAARGRALDLIALFAPGVAAAQDDPRALLTWQPLAVTARTACPDVFAALDLAAGGEFPFTGEQIQAAHSRWTADWLAWERAHDGEFKLKAAAAEEEVARSNGAALARARFDAVEREKLELYQRRYTDYVRVSKALQALRPK